MAKSFYIWKTISKRPNLDDLAFKKAKWQPCSSMALGEVFTTHQGWPKCNPKLVFAALKPVVHLKETLEKSN
jgi:hypothetical protein